MADTTFSSIKEYRLDWVADGSGTATATSAAIDGEVLAVEFDGAAGVPAPLAWWSLNEASGNRADSSGNGYTLTDSGTGVGSTTGKISNAGDFGGGGWLSRSATGLDITGDHSLACWVKLGAIGGVLPHGVMGISDQPGGNTTYLLFHEAGTQRISYANNCGGPGLNLYTGSLTLNTWYLIVATWNDTTKAAKLYVNGAVVDSTTGSGSTSTISANFNIGSLDDNFAGNGYNFFGVIDEAAVFSAPLTATQVGLMYNGGNGISYADWIVQSGIELVDADNVDILNGQGAEVSDGDIIRSGVLPVCSTLNLSVNAAPGATGSVILKVR